MPQNSGQHKHDLVDSLLQSLYETDKDQARALVSSGMDRLKGIETRSAEENPARLPRIYLPRWLTIGLATAAMVLIGVSIPMWGSSRSAMAAVTQSLNQALQDVARHYVVHSKLRLPNEKSKTHQVDLFVKGGEQFALKIPAPIQPFRSIWLGSNRDQSWVVPPIGPVLEGNRRNLSEWFDRREDTSTPYLHITTALELMKELYDLESLPEETVEVNGNAIWCRHVTGRLKGESSKETPDHIDLWANAESGVATRIVATWDLEKGESGRESLTILLQAEVDLGDEFFTPENHGAADRSRLDFSTEN